MLRRALVIAVSTLATMTAVIVGTGAPATAAPGCAGVQVVFARGTAEMAPPIGITGLSFNQALDDRVHGKSVRTSAVNYPASSNFSDRLGFAHNVVDGIKDAQRQIKSIARRCPNTDIVLGGYSQGAVVATYAVADRINIPAKYLRYRSYAPEPLGAEYAKHISAVVLFGTPSSHWIRQVGAPGMKVGAAYRGKTVRYCVAGDNVCDGSPVGGPTAQHVLYSVNGDTIRAADFVARRVH